MAYLYFSAEWLAQIKQTKKSLALGDMLRNVHLITRDLGCQLVMKGYGEWVTRGDGCTVIPFIWRVPSEETLQKCLEDLRLYMEFTNIHPATEQDFTGDPYLFTLRAGQTDFLLMIKEKIDSNNQIIRKQRR